jgi:hypothetical protein
MAEMRNVYNILNGKPEGKRPLVRHRLRLEDDNIMNLREIGCEFVVWVQLSQNRDQWQVPVKKVMDFRVP